MTRDKRGWRRLQGHQFFASRPERWASDGLPRLGKLFGGGVSAASFLVIVMFSLFLGS